MASNNRVTAAAVGWQDNKALAETNWYMLDNEIATDVSFQLDSADSSTKSANIVRTHKFMLVSRSRVFEAMFTGGMIESKANCDVVQVPDVQLDMFKLMLKY